MLVTGAWRTLDLGMAMELNEVQKTLTRTDQIYES